MGVSGSYFFHLPLQSPFKREKRKNFPSIFLLRIKHSLLGISGVSWWLRCSLKMIRGGLLVTFSSALGRPLEFMGKWAMEFVGWKTATKRFEV